MGETRRVAVAKGAQGGVVNVVGSSEAAHADAELLRVAHGINTPGNENGTAVAQVFGDGRMALAGRATAASLGVGNSEAANDDLSGSTVAYRLEVFDANGTSLGFVPIYDSIAAAE